GMHEAERIGELHAVMVIPRPLEELEHTLPVASCWIEQPEPLPLLASASKQTQEVLVELPELESLAIPAEEQNNSRTDSEQW
ncbi:hypothetical protein HC928_25045, partial [bacterium]|nr:hypothetical protein [bacterium]